MRSAMMTLARQNIVMAYDLLPPHDHDMPPDQFRADRVRRLVRDTPYAYMHVHSFSEVHFFFENHNLTTPQDGTLIIHRRCQNKFIFFLLLRLIWLTNHGLDVLLDNHESSREALHHAYSLACTMSECVLLEQGQMTFTKHKFSADGNESKFGAISLYLNSLSEDEKMSLNSWMDHLIICGRSQQGSAVALSDFDLVFEI